MRPYLLLISAFTFPCCVFADEKIATFIHDNDRVGVAYVDAQKGEYIKVTIKNTCDEFTPIVKGVTSSSTPTAIKAFAGCGNLPATKFCRPFEKTFVIPHDGEYEGYQINYQANDKSGFMYRISQSEYDTACNANPQVDPESIATKLTDSNYTVLVNSSPWVAEFSGGLAVSWLTDPHFYVQHVPATGDTPAYRHIARDEASEDNQDLMFAAFAHIRNTNCTINNKTFCRNVAITAGLGTESGQEIDYFLGLSYKLGAAYLTGGYHWGQVNRLKTGVSVGTVVDGTTVTNDVVSETNLSTQTDGAFFLALTYTFGGNSKSDFIKRIAPPSP